VYKERDKGKKKTRLNNENKKNKEEVHEGKSK
jgi:hypothetical protein